jgi:predicted RND superfamily exporter protein
LAARKSMSMPALIGLLLLMGLTTKNSILLVEYAAVAIRRRGMAMNEALLDACRKRARPIVMTTLAMAAGMMPVALGINADMSFRSPMAIAVIGGLITSTLLSLVVVPVVFTYIAQIESLLRRLFRMRPAGAVVPHEGTPAAANGAAIAAAANGDATTNGAPNGSQLGAAAGTH